MNSFFDDDYKAIEHLQPIVAKKLAQLAGFTPEQREILTALIREVMHAPVEARTSPLVEWNPDNIKWTQAEGAKGPYERYPANGEKAESTSDYRNMLTDIKAVVETGKRGMFYRGWWYWVFTDGATVGRKKVKRKR